MSEPAVYFIDDSATMREVMKIAFRRENMNVFAYNDAPAALAEIEKAPPDVVITDVIMPGMSGFEACQFIKRNPRLNRIPVVLLSGLVDANVEKQAADVKADELIRKPFQPQDLISCVRRILAVRPVLPPLPSPVAPPRIPAPKAAPLAAPPDAKLRLEVTRLSTLVNKLKAELVAEREYSRALEEHVRTLQEAE